MSDGPSVAPPGDGLPVLPDPVAERLLRAYLAAGDADRDVPPKRCRPALVDEVLLDAAGPDAEPDVLWKAVELGGLYTLRGAATRYAGILADHVAAGGRTLEPGAQGAMTVFAALVGDGASRDVAHAHFDRIMLEAPDAPTRLPMLITCLVALGPSHAPGRLPGLAAQWRDAAVSASAHSDEAYVRAQDMKRVVNDSLPRALAAVGLRGEIEALPEWERVRRQIRLYAHLDPAHASTLNRWAAFDLLAVAARGREAREALAAMFREELPSAASLDAEGAAFARTRLLRAVEYVAPDSLTPEEHEALEAALESGQEDLISAVQPAAASLPDPLHLQRALGGARD